MGVLYFVMMLLAGYFACFLITILIALLGMFLSSYHKLFKKIRNKNNPLYVLGFVVGISLIVNYVYYYHFNIFGTENFWEACGAITGVVLFLSWHFQQILNGISDALKKWNE